MIYIVFIVALGAVCSGDKNYRFRCQSKFGCDFSHCDKTANLDRIKPAGGNEKRNNSNNHHMECKPLPANKEIRIRNSDVNNLVFHCKPLPGCNFATCPLLQAIQRSPGARLENINDGYNIICTANVPEDFEQIGLERGVKLKYTEFHCRPRDECDLAHCDPLSEVLFGIQGFDQELYRKTEKYRTECKAAFDIASEEYNSQQCSCLDELNEVAKNSSKLSNSMNRYNMEIVALREKVFRELTGAANWTRQELKIHSKQTEEKTEQALSAFMKNLTDIKTTSGPKGERGYRGYQGERGYAGAKGSKGDRGAVGLRGAPGPVGPSGRRGLPGSKGTLGLTGPIGPKGEKGERGNAGFGYQGPRGYTGLKGSKGTKGEMGLPTPTSNFVAGRTGQKGEPGAKGEPGTTDESRILEVSNKFATIIANLTAKYAMLESRMVLLETNTVTIKPHNITGTENQGKIFKEYDRCEIRYNARCFWWREKRALTFSDAKSLCEEDRGSPAMIYTLQHYEQVMKLIRSKIEPGVIKLGVWLGMEVPKSDGSLESEKQYFFNWKTGYPFAIPEEFVGLFASVGRQSEVPDLVASNEHVALDVWKSEAMSLNGMRNLAPTVSEEMDGVLCEN